MPGTSDIEENKIFKDIALGTPGKGRYAGKTDWKKYRDCPLWDNLEKKKKKQSESDTADK